MINLQIRKDIYERLISLIKRVYLQKEQEYSNDVQSNKFDDIEYADARVILQYLERAYDEYLELQKKMREKNEEL